MADYTIDHANAALNVADAGAAVTFTFATPGTYDATTDTWTTPTAPSVTGNAVETEPDDDVYAALSLVHTSARTLFFVPDTYGAVPKAGYAVTWAGASYTVRDVKPFAPDGTVIAATIVIAL